VASLQARSPLRSAHLLLFLNKLVSLVALIALLAAGWMAVSYLRVELANNWRGGPIDASPSAPSKLATVEKTEAGAAEVRLQHAPVRLVYWCGGGAEAYHTASHLPKACSRTALSEEAALRRGLKRCPVCLPE
jgi:hypothetical protein